MALEDINLTPEEQEAFSGVVEATRRQEILRTLQERKGMRTGDLLYTSSISAETNRREAAGVLERDDRDAVWRHGHLITPPKFTGLMVEELATLRGRKIAQADLAAHQQRKQARQARRQA